MRVIVDTNVPIVANGREIRASPGCAISCVRKLLEIQQSHTIVLDGGWHILREYLLRLRSDGQPGVGDAFLKWVLTNRANPRHCQLVSITLRPNSEDQNDFEEFPNDDEELTRFDRSDRKFVAVALVHPEHPPILNAVDTDWWDYRIALERHGIQVNFLCPETMG